MSRNDRPSTTTSMLATAYDAFAGLQDRRGLRRQRQRVGRSATGVVLEIGVGTGRNLPYYVSASRVIGVDPDPAMLERADVRARELACPIELVAGTGEDLPIPAASIDTVVVTLTLCTIPDPGLALDEAHRVLRDGGRLVFLEHVRSTIPAIAFVQKIATPMWARIGGGCQLQRPTLRTIREHRFEVTSLWRSRDGKGSLVQGVAVKVTTPATTGPAA